MGSGEDCPRGLGLQEVRPELEICGNNRDHKPRPRSHRKVPQDSFVYGRSGHYAADVPIAAHACLS
jgi:hypothetical protein